MTCARPSIEIITADCRDYLAQIPDSSAHLVVTDPPYFLDGLDNRWRKGADKNPRSRGAIGGLPVGMRFDPAQGKALAAFMRDISQQLARILVPGAFLLSFSQPRLSHRMALGIEDAGFEIRDIYAWHFTKRAQMKAFSQAHFVDRMELSSREKQQIKSKLQNRKTPQLRPQYESIILAQNPKKGTFVQNWLDYETGLVDVSQSLDGKIPSTVMKVEKPSGDERLHGHMTPKPLQLLQHLIELFSLPGQMVLDPFVGSGSVALAARNANRNCIGIDINPIYSALAQARMSK